MKLKCISGGAALLAAVVSIIYSHKDSLFSGSLHTPVQKNSIFGSVVTSFFPGPQPASVAFKNPFGLVASRPTAPNETIMYFPEETTHLIIDGSSGIPFQLQLLSEFDSLTHDARVTLSMSLHKVMSEEFSGPLSLLWKAAGVRPIPDVRWVRHRGIFSLPSNQTGVDEIDRHLERARTVVAECMDFVRTNSRYLPSTLTEAEIGWSWIFLNLFGTNVNGSKILIAPLVFARRTVNVTRTVTIRRDLEGTSVMSRSKTERGEEILVDGSHELSDGFAFLFHGAWIADESIHRGRFWLKLAPGEAARRPVLVTQNCIDSDGLLSVWLSNDEKELTASRARILRCGRMFILNGMAIEKLSPGRELRALTLIENLFRKEIASIHRPGTPDDVLAPIRFQYFNLLYNELVYWADKRAKLGAKLIEL